MMELILHIVSDAQTLPEAVDLLIKSGAIDPQFVKDLQRFQVFSRYNRMDIENKTGAVIATSLELNVSERTVWRSIERIEQKFISKTAITDTV